MRVLCEVCIQVWPGVLREHTSKLAVLDVPLEQLRSKLIFELVDICLDTEGIRIALRRIYLVFVT